jgi:Ni/Fe-hydrogenase subunit HybB-like protein
MTTPISYHTIDGRNVGTWIVLIAFIVLTALGGLATLYMEHNGHWVTGMTNHVVWGLPHVFAMFLILSSTGALNIASIGSVFEKAPYRPFGRLSGLTALALQAGGLAVLALDLGRSDRLITFMTTYNFTSIFALNVFLYSGFFAFVIFYLWTMMDRRMGHMYRPAALWAFIWRLILTTGSGSIFGFMISRSAYHSTLVAPMFIALSMSFGVAMFTLVMLWLNASTGRKYPSPELLRRLRILLAILVGVSFYMVAIHHLTNFYVAERRDVERFLLLDSGLYASLIWVGFGLIGSVIPVFLLLNPANTVGRSKAALALAAALVVIGGHCFMYSFIIGGEAFPVELFPGKVVSSNFGDGAIASYVPHLPEIILGIGGYGVAGLLLIVVLWALPMLPGGFPETVEPAAKESALAEMSEAH